MIPKSIRDAFGSRWREGGGYSDAAQLQHNVEALVHDLTRCEALIRILSRELERPAPANSSQVTSMLPAPERTSEIPDALAKSPAISELHRASEGGIVWPAHPGRPLLSNVVARLQGVDCADKVSFARKLGTVIAARRRLKIWPCRDGHPLDAMVLFFNLKIWAELSHAAGQVRSEVAR